MILLCSVALFTPFSAANAAPVKAHSAATTTIYVQVMDSCKEGLPGASINLVDSSSTIVATATTAGTKRKTVGSGGCPLQRGNCANVPTGCLTFNVALPASGVTTYTLAENPTYITADGYYHSRRKAPAFMHGDGSRAAGRRRKHVTGRAMDGTIVLTRLHTSVR
jgi:hypothetical protein